MITTIIFSNGQPLKLDLLLRSMNLYWQTKPMIYCIIDYDNDIARKGYHLIEDRTLMESISITHKPKSVVKEVLAIMDLTDFDYVMFLEDTEVFTKPFNPDCCGALGNKEVLTFSNRIGRNHVDCPDNSPIKIIPYHLYDWKNCGDSEFNKQSYSMNGNIYRASDIRKWMKDGDDIKLSIIDNRDTKPYIACYNRSCIASHYDRFDKEQNEQFLQNKHIDMNPFMFFDNDNYDVTSEIPLTLEWRS